MGQLYDIIQRHIDAQAPYEPSVRQVAIQLGVSPTTVSNWRNPKSWPKKDHLEAIARVTGTPYQRVRDAVSADVGYLAPGEADPHVGREVDELREAVRAAREAGATREEIRDILDSETA